MIFSNSFISKVAGFSKEFLVYLYDTSIIGELRGKND